MPLLYQVLDFDIENTKKPSYGRTGRKFQLGNRL